LIFASERARDSTASSAAVIGMSISAPLDFAVFVGSK
jgi:hypothetical protein